MRSQRAKMCFGLMILTGAAVFAQAPAAPKPGAEHKAMGYFAGKWTSEGEIKPSAFGPGGKMTTQDACEWFAGGFQMVCRAEGASPMGKMSSLGILAYNEAEKSYTYYGIDNMGMGELSKGSKNGKTWTFLSESKAGGQTFKSRYTVVETSPTAYTFKWETSADGNKWDAVMEGKTTKSGN
jgi:hypothetical protein